MAIPLDHANINFRYQTLDSQRCEVRLFTFHGRNEHGHLHGHLEPTSLQTAPPYVALSYEWGDGPTEHIITVSDQNYRVRRNLYDYLEHLASKDRSQECLWIDAICINQTDTGERSNQVHLMPEIYSKAAEVRAWFGLLPLWWGTNARFLPQWTVASMRESIIYASYLRALEEPSSPLRYSTAKFTNWAKASGLDHLTILAALLVAQKSYWQRVWIVQEVLLAPSLTFRIGAVVLAPEDVLRVSRAMNGYFGHGLADAISPSTGQDMLTDSTSAGNGHQNAAIILSTKFSHQVLAGAISLRHLLHAFSIQKCREPRDHIFGILGLCSSALLPDYDIDLPQLYLYTMVEVQLNGGTKVHEVSEDVVFRACFQIALAFGWHMSDLTIHLLVNQATIPSKLSQERRCYLWLSCFRAKQRQWPGPIQWIINNLRLISAFLLPSSCWQGIYVDLSYTPRELLTWPSLLAAYCIQSMLLLLLQWPDWELVAPDGQTRTFSGWCREVERVAELVRLRRPLRPFSTEERLRCYPTHRSWSLRARLWLVAYLATTGQSVALLFGAFSVILSLCLTVEFFMSQIASAITSR